MSEREQQARGSGIEPGLRVTQHAMDAFAGKQGIALIAGERERQINAEGWTFDHDDAHTEGSLATAAVGYITGDRSLFPVSWPWKPSTRVRDLTKAGALIAAEIDRLERLGGV